MRWILSISLGVLVACSATEFEDPVDDSTDQPFAANAGLRFFGYYSGDEAAAIRDHANVAWIYAPVGYETSYTAPLVKQAKDSGLYVVLNIQGIVWNLADWTIRPTAVSDWQRLVAALGANGSIDAVKVLYHADEPFNNAQTDKVAMGERMRLANAFLEAEMPDVARLVIFAWVELRPGHEAQAPIAFDAWGHDLVGMSAYSEAQLPFIDERHEYEYYLDNLAWLCPGKPFVLIPDGAMFAGDTELAKTQRIAWQYDIARTDSRFVGVLPYAWTASGTHTGVKENAFLRDLYRQIGREITGK